MIAIYKLMDIVKGRNKMTKR